MPAAAPLTPQEFLAQVEAATEAGDLAALTALGDHLIEGGAAQMPFQPDIRLAGMALDEAEESMAFAQNIANAWARNHRLAVFRNRIQQGYSGPIVVSEGDSWFQYPWKLNDVIDNLMRPYAVHSLGAAGDTLSNMIAVGEYRKAISDHGAQYFLFSASGNDVLGGGDLAKLLNRFQTGMELADVVKGDAVARMLDRIETGYDTVVTEALAARPGVKVFFHGYDRPVPRRGGKWLGTPMEGLQIPPGMQMLIVGHLIDLLNVRLSRVAGRFAGKAYHVDCRGRVGGSASSWYDELHPRNPGYARVADLFEAQMRAVPTTPAARVVPPMPFEVMHEPLPEAAIIDMDFLNDIGDPGFGNGAPVVPPIDRQTGTRGMAGSDGFGAHLSPLDREILHDFRALEQDLNQPDQKQRLEARRNMVPDDDARAFERILGESNLFPINFLSRGARMARAVAMVRLIGSGNLPIGSGSGFLVAPGLLLTNNHVLPSRDVARRAKAMFDHQEDDDYLPVAPKMFDITGDIFFTSDRMALDFSFVSVRMDNDRGQSLEEFGQFLLVEESGKAIKGEPVSIIQHPRGDRKSIALRDSTIVGVKDDFIYYSTDTEPGSSGAPVLNDQWLPVALHHRSVPHETIPGKWIANRGIRISRIFAHLREAAQNGDMDAVLVLRLLGEDSIEMPVPPAANGPLRRGEAGFVPGAVTPLVAQGDGQEAAFKASRWDGIDGYDPQFLSAPLPLPLPAGQAGVLQVDGRPDLPYLHFSVVMHAERKLPMVTACNTDGALVKRLKRTGSWRLDPRILPLQQIGNEAYVNNDYDRGHLVRRVAPMWGSVEEARFAMADTFHYTVCAPQHARLNQGPWVELEDYILDWAEENAARVSILTGPIFRADDPVYRGLVRVPADYWKVAVADTPMGLRAVGYLHTQKNLIPSVEEAFGDYRTHRVPIHVLAELSGLDLSAALPFDVAGGSFETAGSVRLLLGREDIGL